jgi:hypothetical protein
MCRFEVDDLAAESERVRARGFELSPRLARDAS